MKTADERSDESLMTAVADGDRAAYALLVRRHGLKFRALAIRILGDAALADDVTQDAWTTVWHRADRFDPAKARFSTWFYRVVVNRALDMHRIRRADPLPEGFDMEDDRPGAEAGLALSRRDEKVRAALDTLPERQRMAVMLCYFEGLSNAAAAEMLGLHLKALESLLVRARRRLRDALCDDRDDLLLPHV